MLTSGYADLEDVRMFNVGHYKSLEVNIARNETKAALLTPSVEARNVLPP